MNKSTDVNKLNIYREKINDELFMHIAESVKKLESMQEMIHDLSNIEHVLMEITKNKENENDNLEYELKQCKDNLKQKDIYIEKLEQRELEYNKIEKNTLRITELLAYLEQEKNKFEEEKKTFRYEKHKFEEDKRTLKTSLFEANDKINKLSEERDKTKIEIDELHVEIKELLREKEELKISLEKTKSEMENVKNEKTKKLKEKNEELKGKIVKLEKKNEETKENNNELEENISELEKTCEWYKDYARATDQKVIQFYKGEEQELDSHYYQWLSTTLYSPDDDFFKNINEEENEKTEDEQTDGTGETDMLHECVSKVD